MYSGGGARANVKKAGEHMTSGQESKGEIFLSRGLRSEEVLSINL
jgi:hypothetical protein